jgi:hypothetical protein
MYSLSRCHSGSSSQVNKRPGFGSEGSSARTDATFWASLRNRGSAEALIASTGVYVKLAASIVVEGPMFVGRELVAAGESALRFKVCVQHLFVGLLIYLRGDF